MMAFYGRHSTSQRLAALALVERALRDRVEGELSDADADLFYMELLNELGDEIGAVLTELAADLIEFHAAKVAADETSRERTLAALDVLADIRQGELDDA